MHTWSESVLLLHDFKLVLLVLISSSNAPVLNATCALVCAQSEMVADQFATVCLAFGWRCCSAELSSWAG
jgi:hypothetical protein